MINFLAAWFSPPGINILFLTIGLFMRHWWKWSGRLLIAFSLISLYVFSTLAAGNRLLYDLQQSAPLSITDSLKQQKHIAIVVLGGGRRVSSPEFGLEDSVSPLALERIRYAVTIAKQLDFPVLLSGGRPDTETTPEAVLMNQVMIEEFEFPVQFLESKGRNTEQNAYYSKLILTKNNIDTIILVTHAWHMKRALAYFKATGLTVFPAPMGFINKHPSFRNKARWYYPTAEGLRRTTIAFRERLSLWWNRPQRLEMEPTEPQTTALRAKDQALKKPTEVSK